MKRLSLLMAALCIAMGTAIAQNALVVEDFTVPQSGGEMNITLTLSEAGTYSAYQFKIDTPDGIAYAVDEENDVECVLGTGHHSSHQATAHWNPSTKVLGVGVTSLKNSLLEGTTVQLTIPLGATTAEVGSVYRLKLNDITFIRQVGEPDVLDDVFVNVTIGEPDDGRLKFYETATTLPNYTPGEKANVVMYRTIKAGQWSTICLPFAMTEAQVKAAFGDDVQLADFKGYETMEDDNENIVGIKVKFLNATDIEANHPYLIKVTKAVSEFTVDGVDIDPEENPTVATVKRTKKQWSEMIGTYVSTTIENLMLFLSDNQFWYSTGQSKIKAFRAYFDFYDVLTEVEEAYSSRISMVFENEPTGIRLNTDPSQEDEGSVYTLDGRKVQNMKKGVYVTKGKKIVIK